MKKFALIVLVLSIVSAANAKGHSHKGGHKPKMQSIGATILR